jgi:CubicO group peptidase (beta-lactamase class C family)
MLRRCGTSAAWGIRAKLEEALRNVPIGALLDNVSGFEYQRGNLPWKQQPRMYYTTDARALLRRTRILHAPGKKFEAEDLSPLLVAVALESAIRQAQADDTLSMFVSRRLWQPLGAEFPALWNVDRAQGGLEKAESGSTARAIDLARFGQLYLDHGAANGVQIVPRDWVAESTTAPPAGLKWTPLSGPGA